MKLDSKTTADHAAERLRMMILQGDLPHGEPLRQDQLSRQLDVSRTPLRQAFQILDQEGLVEHIGFRGARVRTITHALIDDLFDMRIALEPLALNAAFGNLTKLDFAQAEMALDEAKEEKSPPKLADLNWRFHLALYAPCRRDLLLETIERLYRTSALASVISQSIAVRREHSHNEHVELLDMCREGNESKATTLLKQHLRQAHSELRTRFEE